MRLCRCGSQSLELDHSDQTSYSLHFANSVAIALQLYFHFKEPAYLRLLRWLSVRDISLSPRKYASFRFISQFYRLMWCFLSIFLTPFLPGSFTFMPMEPYSSVGRFWQASRPSRFTWERLSGIRGVPPNSFADLEHRFVDFGGRRKLRHPYPIAFGRVPRVESCTIPASARFGRFRNAGSCASFFANCLFDWAFFPSGIFSRMFRRFF